MRILFSWLGFHDLEEFSKGAQSGVLDEIKKLQMEEPSSPGDSASIASLLNQALFEKVYLLHACKLPFENEFKSWLRPDVESVFLEINNINDSAEIGEKLRIKIAEITDGFKKDFGILRSCGRQEVVNALTEVAQRGTCCYEIKGWKLVEAMLDGQNLDNFKSALKPDGFENILGASQEAAVILHRAGIAAKHHVPVLITGERGTGRKRLAEAISRAGSTANAPLEVIKCITLDYEEFDREFLGTEHADGILKKVNEGALILDEIDKCCLKVQLQLLRTLKNYKGHCEFKPVGKDKAEHSRFKIIATSTCNLLELVNKNEFLAELYYMLATISLETIPLRDRTQDIPLLAHHFLDGLNKQHKAENADYIYKTLSPEATKSLIRHLWPGNVSELHIVLWQAFIFSNGTIIEKNDLPIITGGKSTIQLRKIPLGTGFDLKKEVAELQRDYIRRAIKQADGKKSEAAKLLGLRSYQALDTKMKSLGMDN